MNRFWGSITPQIANIRSLNNLDLSHNLLIGKLSWELGYLHYLTLLNLSHNFLSASIPSTFSEMLSLTSVDISYNNLEGPLPNNNAFSRAQIAGLEHNRGLCGNNTGLQACPFLLSKRPGGKMSLRAVILITVSLLGTLFLLYIIAGIYCVRFKKGRKTDDEPRDAENENMFATWSYDGKIAHKALLKRQRHSTQDIALEKGDVEEFKELSCQPVKLLL